MVPSRKLKRLLLYLFTIYQDFGLLQVPFVVREHRIDRQPTKRRSQLYRDHLRPLLDICRNILVLVHIHIKTELMLTRRKRHFARSLVAARIHAAVNTEQRTRRRTFHIYNKQLSATRLVAHITRSNNTYFLRFLHFFRLHYFLWFHHCRHTRSDYLLKNAVRLAFNLFKQALCIGLAGRKASDQVASCRFVEFHGKRKLLAELAHTGLRHIICRNVLASFDKACALAVFYRFSRRQHCTDIFTSHDNITHINRQDFTRALTQFICQEHFFGTPDNALLRHGLQHSHMGSSNIGCRH